MSNWQSDFVHTNGIRIHYHRTGGDKPTLLLLHGITGNGQWWTRVARALENQYDIVMVDARGHGLSDKSKNGNYSLEDYTADIVELINSLDIGPVLLLGHSLGALIAASVAASYPQLAHAVILEDPPWRDMDDPQQITEEQEKDWMAEWRQDIINQQKQSVEQIVESIHRLRPTWLAEEIPNLAQAILQVDPSVLRTGAAHTWIDFIPKLQSPVLLITGDTAQGAIITSQLAEKIRNLNPLIEQIQIHTGHSISKENITEYINNVRRFFARIDDASTI